MVNKINQLKKVSSFIPKVEATKRWLSWDSQDSFSFILFASIHVFPVQSRPLSVLRNSMRHHYRTHQDGNGTCIEFCAIHQLHQTALPVLPRGSLKAPSLPVFLRQHISVLPRQALNWRLLPQPSSCQDYRHTYHTQLSILSIFSLKMGTLYLSLPG